MRINKVYLCLEKSWEKQPCQSRGYLCNKTPHTKQQTHQGLNNVSLAPNRLIHLFPLNLNCRRHPLTARTLKKSVKKFSKDLRRHSFEKKRKKNEIFHRIPGLFQYIEVQILNQPEFLPNQNVQLSPYISDIKDSLSGFRPLFRSSIVWVQWKLMNSTFELFPFDFFASSFPVRRIKIF